MKTPENLDEDVVSKMILSTVLRLLQRMESQLESYDSRLNFIELAMRASSEIESNGQRTSGSSGSPENLWANVVSEYENSIMNLRQQRVEEAAPASELGTEQAGASGLLNARNRDTDTYSVSVYSGNILEQALERSVELHPGDANSIQQDTIPSIRYDPDANQRSNSLTQFGIRPLCAVSSAPPSRGSSRRSQRYLEITVEVLDTWRYAVVSKITVFKEEILKHRKNQIGESSLTSSESTDEPSRSPARFFAIVETTYSAMGDWRGRALLKLKKGNGSERVSHGLEVPSKERKEVWIAVTSKVRQVSLKRTETLKRSTKKISSFCDGFIAY